MSARSALSSNAAIGRNHFGPVSQRHRKTVLPVNKSFGRSDALRGVSVSFAAQDAKSSSSSIKSQEPTMVTIVGAGRIGSALSEFSPYPTKLLTREDSIDVEGEGPILVCTRNNDLEGVVQSTPEARMGDLVFLQNGMILPWLQQRGLESNTQALIYFAVPSLGSRPIDGITEVDPDGLTKVWGKHAATLSSIIKAGGLTCQVVEKQDFLTSMLEKLIWISAIMLVGTVHGVNAGVVVTDHTSEVSELMMELAEVGKSELGVPVSVNMVERLLAYATSVASFPCAVKEFEWRNGWFYQISQRCISEGKGDPCPLHTSLLKKVGAV